MSEISDALHVAIVGAVTPFIGKIGAQLVGTALDSAGAVAGNSGGSTTSDSSGRSGGELSRR